MAISWDDFDKIWASTSPLTPYNFSEVNYKQGWNFVGATPPARQMWDFLQKQNDEKFKFLRDNFGAPDMVTTAAQMTDTDKIYVYVGSEAGWNNGHWYYYDAGTSTWVDGGVYNSTAFVTDTTLTEAGKAADAKAVGDALVLKADLAGATFTGNVVVNADFSTTGNATVSGDISADDVTANGNLSVVGNATLNGTSTAVTPAEADNSTNIATTAYVQTEIKPIEADVSVNDRRISNIEKLLQGNLYDYQTDTDSAYTKTVPAGAMPYAGIEKVGGKTVVWNQLVDSGTTSVPTINGHKYYTLIDGTASIVTADGTAITIVDDTADMVCDLTLMFGAGNEPTTEEFETMFPASYYPYNAGTLLSAGVTSVVSKDSNDDALQMLSIPAEVRALEGYGWSAGDKKNYIDFERKVYVQEVSKLSFAIANMNNAEEEFPGWNNSGVKAIAGSDLNTVLINSVWLFENGSACGANTLSNVDTLFLINSGMTQTQWKETYPDLVVDFYIARAVPIETDISEYITDDNLIQVESGGTLTFPNSNGDNYRIPVPSTEEYMINLQEAVSNG